MNRPAAMQDNLSASNDPAAICSFDYEAIQAPTKPLIHQSARFIYIKRGRGTIEVGGVSYDIVPNMLVAVTPWTITEITKVEQTLQLILIVYDYQYINSMLKGVPGMEEDSSELLRFLSMEPVAYLDSVQAEYVDNLAEQLKAELGVESTRVSPPPDRPMAQLYVTNKLVELMIMYRRYVMAVRGEKDYEKGIAAENSILSYIYAHSAERLTLASVAGAFFISESTLSKRIADTTGTTFSKLVSGIRIEKASDYLIYTDLTLDAIATLTGFVDASHLSKHFVAQVGVPPIKFRKIYGKSKTKFNRTNKNVAYEVTDYIYKNYTTEKLTASQVASKFGVSVAEMNRLMLYHSDMNFETLLNFVRVNRACELLASTEYYVIDVAFEVGYNNIKTFNTNFLKFKGMTPTEFRSRITFQKADRSEAERTGRRGPDDGK
ncbi:MAG: helix-turn-helix transcriptional regulator [Oscillospiraceae bacterium]|nr:helix-turn-helix transcriptional regulator [Oscillospiraceae bacterium]